MTGTYKHLSDGELFELLRSDRATAEQAFAELYARYSPRVHAYCRRVTSNPDVADDLFQETFVRFFRSAQADRTMTNIPAYILRITRNLTLNLKRDQRRQMVEFDDLHSLHTDAPHENKELLQLISTSLELLPDDYREAFVLREYDGFSYAEIGDIIGATPETVRVRVHRARQKLRDVLAPYLEDLAKHK